MARLVSSGHSPVDFPDKGEWLGQGDFSGGDKERGRQKWPSDRMGGSDPSRPLLSEWRALIFLHWKTRLIKKLRGWSLERGELQVACRANAVLQVAYKSVVPRVAYTIVSTWWNKWTTFSNFHTTQNTCRFCGEGADSIVHIAFCRVTQEITVNLTHNNQFRGMKQFLDSTIYHLHQTTTGHQPSIRLTKATMAYLPEGTSRECRVYGSDILPKKTLSRERNMTNTREQKETSRPSHSVAPGCFPTRDCVTAILG